MGKQKAQRPGKANSKALPAQLGPMFQQAIEAVDRGQLGRAEELLVWLAQQAPDHAPVQHVLGIVLLQTGRLGQAIPVLEKAVRLAPRLAAIRVSLGEAQGRAGQSEAAVDTLRQAIRLDTKNPAAFALLGVVLIGLARYEEAEPVLQTATRLNPRDAQSQLNYAVVSAVVDKPDQARQALSRAVQAAQAPSGDFWREVGKCHRKLDATEEAEPAFRRALAINDGDAEAWQQLGELLAQQHRIAEATEAMERAATLSPRPEAVFSGFAAVLGSAGLVKQAVAAHDRAVALAPTDFALRSQGLLNLNYLDGLAESALFAAHQALAECLVPAPVRDFDNACGAPRPLRVGYVSGDFWSHSVAYFIAPVLAAHDPERVVTYAYYNHRRQDEMTRQLRASCANWRDIHGLSDQAVAARIMADRIDILVDLSGHTPRNRLQVFALQPAPVQITWIGYPNTTGVPAIGYRITDACCDPVGSADSVHTERLLRMPQVFSVYQPAQEAPDVAEVPSLRTGSITFGSFNAHQKINDHVIALWARILAGISEARLVLKASAFKWESARAHLLEAFASRGIDPARITLLSHDKTKADHLGRYADIDIALDPFPYCGTTTTCEALWQGVPVVTLAGQSHRSRVGLSQLSALGLGDLVAGSDDEYVSLAVSLANDPERLRALRATMRERFRASPLMDYPGFTAELEDLYDAAWSRWCEQRSATPAAPDTRPAV